MARTIAMAWLVVAGCRTEIIADERDVGGQEAGVDAGAPRAEATVVADGRDAPADLSCLGRGWAPGEPGAPIEVELHLALYGSGGAAALSGASVELYKGNTFGSPPDDSFVSDDAGIGRALFAPGARFAYRIASRPIGRVGSSSGCGSP